MKTGIGTSVKNPKMDPEKAMKKALGVARTLRVAEELIKREIKREPTIRELAALIVSTLGNSFGRLATKMEPDEEDLMLASFLGINGKEKRMLYAKVIKTSRYLYMTKGDIKLQILEEKKQDRNTPISGHWFVST